MEIGAFFKETRGCRCRRGSPAGPSEGPAGPHPSESVLHSQVPPLRPQSGAGASSLTRTAWRSWQLASLDFKPSSDRGCCCCCWGCCYWGWWGGGTARSSAYQQLIRAALIVAPPRTHALSCQRGFRRRPIRRVLGTHQPQYQYQY